MRRSTKHASTKVSFIGLTGGINVAQLPEQIGEQEMQACENFIYQRDSHRLVGRGGLKPILSFFSSDIRELHYDVGTNTVMVFCADKKAYNIDYGVVAAVYIGDVVGDSIPVCAKFQNKLWIASGGKIQYYDYSKSSLYMVTDSPPCDICFQRNARIFCTKTGDDNAYFSSIGDGATWKEDTNDKSLEQWAEVGYGDDGDIVAVVPLATDLMILKSNGTIYQFIGDSNPEAWQITQIASNTDVIGTMCAVNIGSSVVFLSRRGLKSLNTVMDYGNIASTDIGDKFNRLITEGMISNPRMYHLKRYSTILIRPTSDHRYFISYNYLMGSATILRFAVPIEAVIETSDKILVSSGNMIYEITDEAVTDNGVPISYIIKPRDILGDNKLLIKAIDTKFSSDHAGTAATHTGTLSVQVPTNDRKKVRCNHSTDCISMEVTSSDRFEFGHIALDIADL